jgi:membrane protein
MLATTVFVVATAGLRIYLQYITRTGYTYGALATPIAFLLFAFFLGFAIMMGAELNAAIQEEWPAPQPRLARWRAQWRARRTTAEAAPTSGVPPTSGADQAAVVSPS